jgi:hypothetical protein
VAENALRYWKTASSRPSAAGHGNSSRKYLRVAPARGRASDGFVFVMPLSSEPTLRTRPWRSNPAIARAGMSLRRKYSYELSDRSRDIRMHLDLRISDATAVTTNRRCGDFHEPTVRLPPTKTHPDRPSCTARCGLRSRESSAASPHCRIRRKPRDDPTVGASRPTSRPPQPALDLPAAALTARQDNRHAPRRRAARRLERKTPSPAMNAGHFAVLRWLVWQSEWAFRTIAVRRQTGIASSHDQVSGLGSAIDGVKQLGVAGPCCVQRTTGADQFGRALDDKARDRDDGQHPGS